MSCAANKVVGSPNRPHKRIGRRALRAVSTAAFVALVVPAWAAEPLILKLDPKHPKRIQRWGHAEKKLVPFFGSTRDALHEVEISSNAKFVGVVEFSEGEVEDGEYKTPPQKTLRILNDRGQTVHSIVGVQRYRFSPDGRQVAYILGRYYEGGVGFLPRGAELLDLRTGRRQPIAGLEDAFELEWVQTADEHAVFFRTLGKRKSLEVLRFDLKRKRLGSTGKKALHISPDGRYYLLNPYETINLGLCDPAKSDDGCQRVFERQTDREVKGVIKRRYGPAKGWAYDRGHLLLFTREDTGRVVDVGTRKVVETIRGNLLFKPKAERWISTKAHLLVKKPDRSFSVRHLLPQGRLKVLKLQPRRPSP